MSKGRTPSLESAEQSNAYIRGPSFGVNPVGVEFDPEDWLSQVRQGRPLSDFLVRRVHEPVSPVRGALSVA